MMRISDWRSDVCSSDLVQIRDVDARARIGEPDRIGASDAVPASARAGDDRDLAVEAELLVGEIGHPHASFGKMGAPTPMVRSDEHTSELQSLMRSSYAVFCLKKKKKKKTHNKHTSTHQKPKR